jgi:WD40 repeat protein
VGGNSERIVVLDRVDPRTGEVQPGSSVRIDPEWLGAGESGLSRVVAVWLSDDGLSAVLADLGAEGTQASDGSGDRGRGRGARLWSWNLSTGTGTPLPTSGATSWNGASMSDDGTWLGTVETSIEPRAFAARTWEVRVYELATGNVAFEQSAYRQIPTPPVFSHSGERFLVHGRDRSEAELRQTSDGAQIGQSLVFDGTLSSATFSADDALLMTADGTERVRLWSGLDGAPLRHTFLDAKTRRPVNCPLEGKNFHRIQRVSLSPEGRTLAAMSLLDESIRFWDIDRGTQIGQTLQRQPTTCVFLNDGRDVRLLGNPVQTWRLPGGEPAVAAPWSSEGIEPDPAALRLWAEVITGRELTNTDTLSSLSVEEWNVRRDRQRGADAVATTTIPSASPQSAAAGRAFTGTVWPRNLPVRMRADFLTIVTVAVASLSTQFSHDGTRMLNVNMLEAQLFEVATGQPVGEPIRKNQLDQFHCAAFSADSSRLLVGSGTDLKSGVVQIWDARSGTLAGGPLEHDGAVGAVAFSPQGDLFACGWGSALPDQAIGGFRGRLQLWDAATLAPIGPPQDVDGRVTEMHFTPDGRRLFTASCLGTNARLWDVETMQPIGEPMRHEAGVMASAMSPDGSVIATGSYDHVVRLWSTETGAAAAEPLAHSGIVCELAFSPDGRRFASGSYDGLLQMWDAATWQAIAEPLKLAAPLVHVEYSPDSGVLAIIDSSLKPRFFDAADGSEFASPLDAASVGGFVGFLEGRAPVVWNGQSIQVLGAIELRSSKQP